MIRSAFKKGPVFVAYLTIGDGGLDYSLESALALESGGVDLLEIGIPFSDPVADGPVIQKAMQRALEGGAKLADVITFIEQLRRHSQIPLVLFTYYNPVFQGGEKFLQEARQAGADGILILDQPCEEAEQNILDQVFIVSPSTTQERLSKIARQSRGFLYYVCQKGVTGVRQNLPAFVADDLKKIKNIARTPVVAGFGISERGMAKEILRHADGFVVGSYFVQEMGKRASPEKLSQLAIAIDPRREL